MRIVYGIFAAVLLGFMFFVAFQPIEVHTYGRTIIDDGYYYLGYAWNIAAGNGPTFDGIVNTNGVQPLWAVILSALALMVPDRVNLIYAMLALSNVLSVLAAVMMYLSLRQFLGHSYALLGGGLLLLTMANPMLGQQGMELNLNMFVLLWTWYMVLRIKNFAPWPLLCAGLVIGLVCLGRIDNLILTPVFALTAVYRICTAQPDTVPVRRLVGSVVLLALPALLLMGAYLLINLGLFERLLPVSGDVKALLVEQRIGTHGRFSLEYVLNVTHNAVIHLMFVTNYAFGLILSLFGPQTWYARIILVTGIVLLAAYVVSRWNRKSWAVPKPESLTLLVVVLGVFNIGLHTWLMFFQLDTLYAPHPWYYVAE